MNSDTKRDLLQILLVVICWIAPIIAMALPDYSVLSPIAGFVCLLISIFYLLKKTIFKKNAWVLIVYESIVLFVGLVALF